MPKKLPAELDSSIIRSILSPLQSPSEFGRLCNSLPGLYGTPNSLRRRTVTNRKYSLTQKRRNDPGGFNTLCRSLGIATDEGAEDEEEYDQQEESDEEEDNRCGKVNMANKNYRSMKPEFLESDDDDFQPSATSATVSTITLSVDKPEANRDGIFAYILKDVLLEKEKELIEAIVVVFPLADINDSTNLISATLLKDGSGLEITQPTAPSFMFDKASVECMYIAEDPSIAMSQAMVLGHVVAANTISANPIRQKKKVTVLFPNGMKCRKGPFNDTDDNFKLIYNVFIVEGALYGTYQFYNSAVYWKLVVNRAEKRATALSAPPSDGTALIVAALQQLKKKSITSDDSSMSVDGESKKSATDDKSVTSADSFFAYGNDNGPADGAVSDDDLSGTVLFVGTPLNGQTYAPLLNDHNVWDNSPDLVPSVTNNSTFAVAAAEPPIDPFQGVPIGPIFLPAPAASSVDRSREVADFVREGNEEWKTKRLRLPTKTYVMDDEDSL